MFLRLLLFLTAAAVANGSNGIVLGKTSFIIGLEDGDKGNR
jgi:hypothetical protein